MRALSRLRLGAHAATVVLGVLAVAIAVVCGVCVALITKQGINAYIGVWLVHTVLFALAVAVVLRSDISPRAFWLILLGALVFRLIAIWVPHEIVTTDALRYVWDGRIQWHGWNPYLYFPAAPDLEYLRDAEIYSNLNQKERAVTIYPPAAEILFLIGYLISDSVWGQKIVMLVMEGISITALIAILRGLDMPRERVIVYAWHPLPIWEFVSQAHLDAAAVAFLLLGIWAVSRHRQGVAGAMIALGVLVKYYPILLVPAVWRRWDWRMPVAAIAVAVALYVPYVWNAGPQVIGFLSQHLDNEGYKAGWGFHVIWMLRDFGIVSWDLVLGRAYTVAALIVLAGIAAGAFFMRPREVVRPHMLVLLTVAFVWLTSPHYPWYFGCIVPFICLYLSPSALFMTLASVLLYWPRSPDGITWTHIYAIVFLAPVAIALAQAAGRRVMRRLR